MITKVVMNNYTLKIAGGRNIRFCFVRRGFTGLLLIFVVHSLYVHTSSHYTLMLRSRFQPSIIFLFVIVSFYLQVYATSILLLSKESFSSFFLPTRFIIIFPLICQNECSQLNHSVLEAFTVLCGTSSFEANFTFLELLVECFLEPFAITVFPATRNAWRKWYSWLC